MSETRKGPTGRAEAVRFTRWDLERWDDKKGGSDAPAEDDLVPGREHAPPRFMAPYPASLFKLLLAYRWWTGASCRWTGRTAS